VDDEAPGEDAFNVGFNDSYPDASPDEETPKEDEFNSQHVAESVHNAYGSVDGNMFFNM
jgi:hypothetical protein